MTQEQFTDIFIHSLKPKERSYDEQYVRRLSIRLDVSFNGLKEVEQKIRNQEKLNTLGTCIGRHPAYFAQLFQQGRKGEIYNQLKDWILYVMKDCNYYEIPTKSVSLLESEHVEQIISKTRDELYKANATIRIQENKIQKLENRLTILNPDERRSDAYQAEIIKLQEKLKQAKDKIKAKDKTIQDLKSNPVNESNSLELQELKTAKKRLEKLVDLLMAEQC